MPRVLIVASADLTPELGDTLLWRADITRVFSPSHEAALDAVRAVAPSLVIIDGIDTGASRALVERLRAGSETRGVSLIVLSRSKAPQDERALRQAGANLVLSGHVDPALWDSRLEELLHVAPRREMRVPVLFEVSSSRLAREAEPVEAWALNVSVRGVLLETPEAVDAGTRLDLRFALPPDARPIRAVGRVARQAGPKQGRFRSGVEFLMLRGDARSRLRSFIGTRAGV
jgi:CheY-like chemotaxis protein